MAANKFLESEKNKRMVITCVAVLMGVIIMPHDDAVATIVTKYIFPAVVSGVCFGIAIMSAIDMMKAEERENGQDGTKGE